MNTSSTTQILYLHTTTKTITMNNPVQEEQFSVAEWSAVASLRGVTFYSQRARFMPRPLWEHAYPQKYFFFLEQVNAVRYERHVRMTAGDFNTFNFGHFVYEVNNQNQAQNAAAPADPAAPNQPVQGYAMPPFATVNPADLVLPAALPAVPVAVPAAVPAANAAAAINPAPPVRPEFVLENGRYNCSACTKQYASRDGMVYHWETVHEGVKYNCSVCDTVLSRYYGMIGHIKEKHGGEGKPVKGQW